MCPCNKHTNNLNILHRKCIYTLNILNKIISSFTKTIIINIGYFGNENNQTKKKTDKKKVQKKHLIKKKKKVQKKVEEAKN